MLAIQSPPLNAIPPPPRESNALINEELVADPGQTIEPINLLTTIYDELGTEIDFATLPDQYLFASFETANPGELAPDPRATSPP